MIQNVMANSTMVFFEPIEAFWSFIGKVPWRYKGFHDCGAGVGHLATEMKKRGFVVTAYDLFPRNESLTEVEQLDTSKDLFIANNECVIIARPCHGTGWIEGTLKHAVGNGDAFYISKPKNIRSDLKGFIYEVVAKKVGKEGESLVRVFCHKTEAYEQRLIINHAGHKEWWWYDPARKRYVSQAGGLAGFDDQGEKVLDKRFLGHDYQVYTPKSEACDDKSDQGWIAPDGEFFGCNYAQHDYVAQHVIGCTVGQLETSGWIRAYGEQSGRMLWSFGTHGDTTQRPTPAQARMLRRKGYKVDRFSGGLLSDKGRA